MNELLQSFDRLAELEDAPLDERMLSFLLVVLVSLVCSIYVAYLYRRFYATRETGTEIYRSFVLLGPSITAIFICIQFSLPLSLGLLGALSIVRFRTPIKEPEEIGYLMVLIAVSLACATFNFGFVGGILIVSLVGAWLQDLLWNRPGQSRGPGLLLLTVSESDFDAKHDELLELFESELPKGKLESLTKSDNGVALAYSFRDTDAAALVRLPAQVKSIVEPTYYSVSHRSRGV